MATTYWTGLPTFQSGLLRHCLTCSQLDSSPCPELSSTSTHNCLWQEPDFPCPAFLANGHYLLDRSPTFQSGLLDIALLTVSQVHPAQSSVHQQLTQSHLRSPPDVRVPLPSDGDIFSNSKPGSPVVAAPVAVTTGMPSCGTFRNHFENHSLIHCDTLQYHNSSIHYD